MILQVAAKALVTNKEGQVLILREAKTYEDGTNHGRYQLPGGRLDPGESYENGLDREVMEESGLRVKQLYPIFVGEWRPVIKGVPHQIIAVFTVCEAKTNDVKLSIDHDDYKWIDPKDYSKYDIMEPEDEVFERYNSWGKRES